jgi:hypothetical protein
MRGWTPAGFTLGRIQHGSRGVRGINANGFPSAPANSVLGSDSAGASRLPRATEIRWSVQRNCQWLYSISPRPCRAASCPVQGAHRSSVFASLDNDPRAVCSISTDAIPGSVGGASIECFSSPCLTTLGSARRLLDGVKQGGAFCSGEGVHPSLVP